ncbi:MAG: hypothetical protein KDJ26_01640 [Alphaproteobacteria bacterium]|nr:hypothetical protein [Alphaproteobacteria bacterium]MCB9985346.1 hypothetical protein [Micavibrio sp.]
MIRTLWYLIKICLVLGVATYLAMLPGEVMLEWNIYNVTLQMGFLAVSSFLFFLVLVYASGLAYRIISFPSSFARYRKQRRQEQGHKALLRSLTAAALGDHKNARYLAHRAQKLLPESESGLPLLLQAQAVREMGDAAHADEPYQMLLKNTETSLLGLQGLIQNAIMSADFSKALILAREAFQKYPKNYQLLRAVYDLEIRNRLWSDALNTLDQAVKRKVIERDKAFRDRVAIYCVLGDMALAAESQDEALVSFKKAVDGDALFVPAVVRLARLYKIMDQRKKAVKIVLQAWKKVAHPELISVWADLMPSKKSGQVSPKFKWVESISDYHGDKFCLLAAMARAAIEDGLWGDARAILARAEKLQPNEEVYLLWVMLEEKTSGRADVIRQWLDRAYHASQPAQWVCSKTKRCFPVWQAVVEPEGFFNTLEWCDDLESGSSDPVVFLPA